MQAALDLEADASSWLPAPPVLRLAPADVHVWRLRIDELDIEQGDLEATLTPDERARAARFVFAHTRRSFVVTRAILRRLLARYINEDPRQLRFRYGAYGKPALERPARARLLPFNLAHSHGLALFAISGGGAVGVDVEHVRSEVPCDDLARRFFTANEIAALRRLAGTAQRRGFFKYWARKEAIVKATGEGMMRSPSSFEVLTNEVTIETQPWSLADLDAGSEYAAAVAAEAAASRITRYVIDRSPEGC